MSILKNDQAKTWQADSPDRGLSVEMKQLRHYEKETHGVSHGSKNHHRKGRNYERYWGKAQAVTKNIFPNKGIAGFSIWTNTELSSKPAPLTSYQT